LSYAANRRVTLIADVNVDLLDGFIVELSKVYVHSTLSERVGKIKAFLRHCWRLGWIPVDLASKIKIERPEEVGCDDSEEGNPLTPEQFIAALSACDDRIDYAYILTGAFSGLAVIDVTTCPKDGLGPLEWSEEAGMRVAVLKRRRQKTGQSVEVYLPEFVVQALDSFPHRSQKCWFWTGTSTKVSAAKTMGERITKVFRRAGISEGSTHRLKHTFADRVLSDGRSMADLSVLLGHKNEKTTAKHYAALTRGRLDRAKDSAVHALANDPVAKLLDSGTLAAHEGLPRAN